MKGEGRAKCSNEVRDYLDTHLKGWRIAVLNEKLSTTEEIPSSQESAPAAPKRLKKKTSVKLDIKGEDDETPHQKN